MHDAVAGLDHIDIFKCFFGPVDEMESVFVTAIFDGTVFSKGIFIKTCMFDG